MFMSFVAVLAIAAATTGPARAQYLKDPPPDYASISRAVGDFPESGSNEFMSDGKDCRQLALWIYGKFENEQDNEK